MGFPDWRSLRMGDPEYEEQARAGSGRADRRDAAYASCLRCGRGSRLPFAQERASVAGLMKARKKPPRLLRTGPDGSAMWDTPCGELCVSPGADELYVVMVSSEIYANVYYLQKRGKSLSSANVLDCGANAGTFALFALRQGAKRVIAFKPSPTMAACLRKNLAEGIKSGRAVVIQKGLWDQEAPLAFSTATKGNPGAHHVVEGGPSTFEEGIEITAARSTPRSESTEFPRSTTSRWTWRVRKSGPYEERKGHCAPAAPPV